MGVLPIKRSILPLILILILSVFSACGSGQDGSGTMEGTVSDTVVEMTSTQEKETTTHDNTDVRETEEKNTAEPDRTTIQPEGEVEQGELLQSASVDLDGDGQNEQVKVVQVLSGSKESGVTGEVEGRLVIGDAESEKVITFLKEREGLTGIMTSMEFEDLDNDGSDDIFIIIPGSGASFSNYKYFIYSYKKDANYTFSSDNTLAEFIDGFEASYINGGNKLTISNEKYNFSADLAIESISQEELNETMQDYVNSMWIEPVSVHIDEDSRLSLIKDSKNGPEIKIPLPVFGLATIDMIGEIDLFFLADDDFKPVLDRFELLDFAGSEKVRVGSCKVR